MQGMDSLTTNLKEFLAQLRSIKLISDTSQSLWTMQIWFCSFWMAIMQAKITIQMIVIIIRIETFFPFYFIKDSRRRLSFRYCLEQQSNAYLFDIAQQQLNLMNYLARFLLIFALLAVIQADLQILNVPCQLCHDILFEYQRSIPIKPTEEILDIIATKYCTKKHLQNANVCKGAVHEMMESIINSVWRHYTDPHSICHKLRFCPKQYKVRNLNDDIKSILAGKPNKQWEKPTQRKTLKVMHISDLHIDLFYTAGAASKCSEPVCCRSNVTLALDHKTVVQKLQNKDYFQVNQSNDKPANFWGSLEKCDLPYQTFSLFVDQLSKLDVDMILWTGDNTPHDIWQQTQSYNLNFTFIESEQIKRATKARVIAAMGNHQSFPVNVYDYEGQRQKMLIGGLAQAWKQWLDDKAYNMLRTKGYFSIVLPEFNNLKVISVNTQAQNDQNWYLLRNPTDAGGMLKWIEEELKESQQKGQFVYIIGHISPKSAMNEWSMRFNALTDRYSYIIRGQFYGHSHSDHFGFFPSFANTSNIVNYFFIAPSLTTYSGKHPEYRIMTVDYDTLQVLDYEQYRLDISKYTKKQDKAKFELFYSFKQAYGLSDLTIKGGMTELRQKMEKDNDTQIKYSFYRSSGTEKGHAGRDVFCDTTSSPSYETTCSGGTSKPSLFDKVSGKWKDLQHK